MLIFKTLAKLMGIWLALMGVLAVAFLCVLILALIIRFKVLFAVAVLFIGLAYLFVQETGVEVTAKPKYVRMKTVEGEEVLVRVQNGCS